MKRIFSNNTRGGPVKDLLYLSCMGVTADDEKLFVVPDAVLTHNVRDVLDRLTEHGYDWKLTSEAGA